MFLRERGKKIKMQDGKKNKKKKKNSKMYK